MIGKIIAIMTVLDRNFIALLCETSRLGICMRGPGNAYIKAGLCHIRHVVVYFSLSCTVQRELPFVFLIHFRYSSECHACTS